MEDLLEEIAMLKESRDFYESQYESYLLKFEEKELEFEELVMNKEEEVSALKKNCQSLSLELDRFLKTIEDLTEALSKEKKKVIQLEIKNEDLESKVRLAEASLETATQELESVSEELALFKIESSYVQSSKLGVESPEIKTHRHIEIQTDTYSFISLPIQSTSPERSTRADITPINQPTIASGPSPTLNVIKNLILSPTEIKSNFPKTTYNSKDSLRKNVFSKEFSLAGSHPSLPDNKRTTPGSPTPLKVFLIEQKERLKKCRESACMVDLTKKHSINGGNNSQKSQKSSLANSANQSAANLPQYTMNLSHSWYKEGLGSKKGGSSSKSLKRSLEKIEQSNSRKQLKPSALYQHDEFTHQFFGKSSKVHRSSVELAGESFASKLGAILQEREVFKLRPGAHHDNEGFVHGHEIFDNFKTRLHKNKAVLVNN
jgi:hypothetical protein